jgi:integrase
MPKVRSPRLESASARLKLPVRKRPVWVKISIGVHLGYRRNQTGGGSWTVRASDGHGHEWEKRLGLSDDFEPAAPPAVLSYWQALEAARKLARRQPGEPADESRPVTVAESLDAYACDLRARGANLYNAQWARAHLPSALLAKPVGLLSSGELRRWRDALLAKGLRASTVNRLRNSARAAFELAAKHDRRIANQSEWRAGLETLADSQQARNVVLSDDEVRRLVAAAYARDRRLGLLIDVLATTGARPSQVARVTVEDLRADALRPTLAMPRSSKGGGRARSKRKAERYSVPISPPLGAQLAQEAVGRDPGAALLTRDGSTPWGPNPHANYKRDFAAVVAAAGLDPEVVTAYSLRHSSICRAIFRNIPIRLVASAHDTSVPMIEANYSKFISEHSDADAIMRRGLLEPEVPAKVVSIAGR